MAKIHIYRNYRFLDKDPIIDKMKTLIEDEGIREDHAAIISDLERYGLQVPQLKLGYDMEFVKHSKSKLDVEKELEQAAKWAAQRKKANGHTPKRLSNTFKFD